MAGGAALATASLIRPREARAAKSMTVVLESEVTILDPHVITATITRTFGLHVFDMLFAMNEKGEIKPQMVEGYDAAPTSSPGPSPCATASSGTTATRSRPRTAWPRSSAGRCATRWARC